MVMTRSRIRENVTNSAIRTSRLRRETRIEIHPTLGEALLHRPNRNHSAKATKNTITVIFPRDLLRRKGIAPKEPSDIKSLLERSLDSLAKWLELFTALVVLGLVVEYTPDVIDAIMGHAVYPHIIGGILITIGVVGELVISFWASRLDGKLRDVNNSSLEEANARSKQLEHENLILQSDLLKLRKESEPRRLTGLQREKLIDLLKPHPDGCAVVSALLDPESSDFADDFDAAFHGAHWETLRIRNRASAKYGVLVAVVPGGCDRPGAKILSDALTAAGVPHEYVTFKDGDASTSPAFQAGYIYLVIEHKPPTTINTQTKK